MTNPLTEHLTCLLQLLLLERLGDLLPDLFLKFVLTDEDTFLIKAVLQTSHRTTTGSPTGMVLFSSCWSWRDVLPSPDALTI